jgi:hypothetical protein
MKAYNGPYWHHLPPSGERADLESKPPRFRQGKGVTASSDIKLIAPVMSKSIPSSSRRSQHVAFDSLATKRCYTLKVYKMLCFVIC